MIWEDDWELVIEGWEGATILSPANEIVVLEIDTMEALNYTRTIKDVVSDEDAAVGDQFKFIMLDASVDPVTYTIDPVYFTGLTIEIRSKDATQRTHVAAATGTIQLKSGQDQTPVELLERETIKLYSDGTNLIEV